MGLMSLITAGAGAVMGFIGNNNKRKAAQEQERNYREQQRAALEVGDFNAAGIRITGTIQAKEQLRAIDVTKKKAINTFRARGISLEGSPMFVLGDIDLMGDRQVQETLFNTAVNRYNAIFNAEASAHNLYAAAEQAHYQANAARLAMIQQGLQLGMGMMNGMGGGGGGLGGMGMGGGGGSHTFLPMSGTAPSGNPFSMQFSIA